MRRYLIVFLASSSIAFAQSGEWGSRGITHRLIVRGDRVYAADGRGIAVYDASTLPVRRAAVAETIGESFDVAAIGDRDLAVATRAGIERYSIAPDGTLTNLANYPGANPTVIAGSASGYLGGFTASSVTVWTPDMSVVAMFPVTSSVSALAWHGDTLIAAIPGIGITLFDVAGRTTMSTISEGAQDIAVAGDTLYIAGGINGVIQYDITDETAPRVLSRTEAGGPNFTRIAVDGERLVAAEVPSAIDVFDLSSGTPVLTKRFEEPVETVGVSGSHLFEAGSVVDAHGFTRATGAPLRVWDLSDASAPKLADQYSDFAGPLSGVMTDGTLAYVVDPPFFRVIDVSTTTSPRELSSLPIDNIGDYVRVRDNLAMVYGRGLVQLVDITNPYMPLLIRTWNASGGPPSTATFVGTNFIEANPFSGFHVVDFNNFATPGQIGGIKGHYYDVVSDGGNVAYVAQDGVALGTVDVTNSRGPFLATSTVIGPVQSEIAAATSNHPELLVTETRSGVRIYSLATARSPQLMSFIPAMAIGVVAADGDTAYVATAGAVQTIDLRDPAHAQLGASAMRAVAPMRIAAANGKVVIADKYSLRIYGANTPPPPPSPPVRRHVADH